MLLEEEVGAEADINSELECYWFEDDSLVDNIRCVLLCSSKEFSWSCMSLRTGCIYIDVRPNVPVPITYAL